MTEAGEDPVGLILIGALALLCLVLPLTATVVAYFFTARKLTLQDKSKPTSPEEETS